MRPTGRLRVLPDFLVIGAQRAGTSSLYRYLGEHPWVWPASRKETEYFSVRYDYGEDWYRAHFPLAVTRALTRAIGRGFASFEATPDYLFHPLAAERAARLVPGARIIVLLRDPVARAFSHYRHSVRLGRETLPFEEAIEREASRLEGEAERLVRDCSYRASSYLTFSYQARGFYAEQLERWFRHYPRDRVLVLRSEELFRDPAASLESIQSLLALPVSMPRAFRNYSYEGPDGTHAARREPGIDPQTRDALAQLYAPHNRRLERLLGWTSSW
jgi:hypothetical protein